MKGLILAGPPPEVVAILRANEYDTLEELGEDIAKTHELIAK